MDAALVLIRRGVDREAWVERFQEYVRFSLVLGLNDGARFLARAGDFRANVRPDLLKYVRSNEEIAAVTGDKALAEARYRADGDLDITKWSRPQHDGPALTALVGMRFWRLNLSTCEETRGELAVLIRRDLEYTLRHAGEPCYRRLGGRVRQALLHDAGSVRGSQGGHSLGRRPRRRPARSEAPRRRFRARHTARPVLVS